MDLRQLEHFVAVAEHLSFSKAARHVHLSQPALSASVRALEEDLGVTLFSRNTRRVAITSAGQTLLPGARQMIGQAARLRQEVAGVTGLLVGSVRIGLVQTLAGLDLAGAVSRLHARHPRLELRLSQDTVPNMCESLRRYELDLAFVYANSPATRGLVTTPVVEEELVLVTPAGHALAGRPVIDPARLQDETWIDFGPGTDLLATIELLVERRRLRRHVAARVGQMSVIIDLVRAGLGIAIVPRPVAAGSGLPMVRLGDADTTRTLALARVGGPPSSSAVDVVMRELLGAEGRIG